MNYAGRALQRQAGNCSGELLQPRACLEDLSAEVNYKTEITQQANPSLKERNTGGARHRVGNMEDLPQNKRNYFSHNWQVWKRKIGNEIKMVELNIAD